ncbi:helix-turn-helix domain-containing protein [Rhizobium sp. RCC_161_2]|uniref:helix-turn-helix domain-containing protein n=1 Tax=Rhizobium sp. RCC_161_2 TaxID=3239219 RepID=UPI00352426BB
MSSVPSGRRHDVASSDGPDRHPVDIYVGQQIQLARKKRGMPQKSVAKCLGLTFQQVQKYEYGANRVSASMLFGIAMALETPVAYFFEGLADTDEGEPVSEEERKMIAAFLNTVEGRRLAKAFVSARLRIRQAVAALLEAEVRLGQAASESTD